MNSLRHNVVKVQAVAHLFRQYSLESPTQVVPWKPDSWLVVRWLCCIVATCLETGSTSRLECSVCVCLWGFMRLDVVLAEVEIGGGQ